MGLSPRVRGNLVFLAKYLFGVRPIPACAGQPVICAELAFFYRAYPRVCGATKGDKTYHLIVSGLSPRVRGNLPPLFP